ncbi:MAG: hypothetical protein FJ118_08005 [Deltaproteobacteria bacterium]|nr:hypothetical protein [Deltaproteobacteria bacterium]
MSPAAKIIAKFGGQSALAKLLGKKQSTIQNWYAKGVIPAKWQNELLRLAREINIEIGPEDFFQKSTDAEIGEEELVEKYAADSPSNLRVPRATHGGELQIGDATLPCYVLETGERVFSLKGIMVGLIGIHGGPLEDYVMVAPLKPHLSAELTPEENGRIPALMRFDTGSGGWAKHALGLPVEKFMDLCSAYSAAAEHQELTPRQKQIAVRANSFLRACAKVGIIALVDEATGYQYERMEDALQFKLKLFLEEEMRKWEKTFPDALWIEFGRLTNWKGSAHQRPKYWGKLVMELVYDYLDPDVAEWLKSHAPKPRTGQNYHQWLSSQYGLKRLVEHIWMLIGMAKTCQNITELRQRMAEQFGRVPTQITLYLPPTTKTDS